MSVNHSQAKARSVALAHGRGLRALRRQEEMAGLLLAAPALILLTVFLFVPAIMAFGLSFSDQRLLPGPQPTQFVGLRNYTRLFSDAAFLQALRNNLYFT